MKKTILLIAGLILLSGCIKFKSPFVPIQYYRLNPEPYAVQMIDTIDVSIQMRNLSINDEFNTDHIIATLLPDKEVKVYFYHRWVSQFDDLATGYILSRINGYGVFSGGILPASSINLPNYIVEGRVLNVQANNNDTRNVADGNWVEITINFSLHKRNESSPGLSLMLNKNYTHRVNRNNSAVENIPAAMSRAIAFVSDMMLVDIHKAISLDLGN